MLPGCQPAVGAERTGTDALTYFRGLPDSAANWNRSSYPAQSMVNNQRRYSHTSEKGRAFGKRKAGTGATGKKGGAAFAVLRVLLFRRLGYSCLLLFVATLPCTARNGCEQQNVSSKYKPEELHAAKITKTGQNQAMKVKGCFLRLHQVRLSFAKYGSGKATRCSASL